MSSGKTHAATAAAVTAAVAALLRSRGYPPEQDQASLAELGADVALLAPGAALIPDADHPESTAARTAGFVGRPFFWLIDKVTDHRGATHSLVTAGFVSGALGVAQHYAPVVGAVAATVLTGLALDLRKPGTNVLAAIIRFGIAAGIVAGLTEYAGVTWQHLPWLLFLGWGVAALGDSCTDMGASLLYLPCPERWTTLHRITHRRYYLGTAARRLRTVPGRPTDGELRIYNGSFVVVALGVITALGFTEVFVAEIAASETCRAAWGAICSTVRGAIR